MKTKYYLFLALITVLVYSTMLLTSCEREANDTVIDIDDNTYKTVTIGNQIWMADNLRTTTYNDGSPITLVEADSEWINLTSGAYCWYKNDEATYGSTYGALYNWYAVDRFKLCPDGWRVPNDEEWRTFEEYLTNNGHNGTEGLVLKAKDGWSNAGSGTDYYGFKALPGGERYSIYEEIGECGYWWCSTAHTDTYAIFWMLSSNSKILNRFGGSKVCGFSVRCIKN